MMDVFGSSAQLMVETKLCEEFGAKVPHWCHLGAPDSSVASIKYSNTNSLP